MSTQTYQIIVVGPAYLGPTINSCEVEVGSWLNLDNDIADLKSLDFDHDNSEAEDSPAERARHLLEELEKEGKSLEEALGENFGTSDGLGVFPDITSIPPVSTPTHEIPSSCLTTSVDAEALLRDLEAIILPEVTPPQSPPNILTEIDELLFLRSYSLPDPIVEDCSYLPPTPNSMSPHSSVPSPYTSPLMLSPAMSPCYASMSPHSSVQSPYSSPLMLSPAMSPCYAPSTPASSPYPASSTSWDSESVMSSDPDWDAPGPSRGRKQMTTTQRNKPYARKPPADRKERKKLQNKNAATKYRLKKKAEEDVLLEEESELRDKNEQLKTKFGDLQNEVRIIRNLLRDQCKRLGIIK